MFLRTPIEEKDYNDRAASRVRSRLQKALRRWLPVPPRVEYLEFEFRYVIDIPSYTTSPSSPVGRKPSFRLIPRMGFAFRLSPEEIMVFGEDWVHPTSHHEIIEAWSEDKALDLAREYWFAVNTGEGE